MINGDLGGGEVKRLLTITEAAKIIGVTAKTIIRWEKQNKIPKVKRDWRNWRVYDAKVVEELVKFRNRIYDPI